MASSAQVKNGGYFSNRFCDGQDTPLTKCSVKGEIPSWLSGKMLRNGPGEFEVGKETFKHWFDGHAILHRFDIADGEVHYISKFLESEGYKTNKKHNKIVVAGFGTPSVPDPCKNTFARFFSKFFSKSPPFDNCNVNIANLGDAYYVTTDASTAYRIDPQSLDAKNFHSAETFGNLRIVTAHPHYDRNGDYYNLGEDFGRSGYYGIGKVPAESMDKDDPLPAFNVVAKIPMDNVWKPSYFHSFALSENYIAVHDQSVRFNVPKLLKSLFVTWDGVMSAYEHDKTRESIFHVVDKNTYQLLPIKFAFKGKFTFHHINAYEEKTIDGKKFLIVDLMCSDDATFFWLWTNILRDTSPEKREKVAPMWPLRFALPLDVNKDSPRGSNLVTVPGCQATAVVRDDGSVYLTPEELFDADTCRNLNCNGMELPQTNYKDYNGRKYKYFYCIGENEFGVPNQLLKVDVETKQMVQWQEENRFPSEPVFIPKPDAAAEDDGVILSTVLSANPQDPIFMLILDAKDFKEIARAEITTKLPYPLHGCFIPSSKC